VSKGSDVSFRTLQRWVAGYKREGLAGLVRKGRTLGALRQIIPQKLRQTIPHPTDLVNQRFCPYP
jgi:putative transposase